MVKIQAPAPPYLGPVAHSSGTGNKPIRRIVIHCTVSPCVKGGARDIARYFQKKTAGGSAHYVVDPGEAIQSAYDSVVAWHAPPNSHSLGVELCDPMTGPDSRWRDTDHEAMLRKAAALVAQLCLAYDVPVKRLSVADLKAGHRGICGHVDVSGAFKQSTHWDPGPGFPWGHFMTLVRAAVVDLTGPRKPDPAPVKTPAKAPAPKARILSAGTVVNTPSDHLMVHARLQAGAAVFEVACANIRATPPMLRRNVQKCISRTVGLRGVTVAGFNEMGARDLAALLKKHPTWRAVQGPPGDRRRAPLGYDSTVWAQVDTPEFRLLSSKDVTTKLGRLAVPSGNRYATVVVLRHKATGEPVAFVCYHAIAHMNVGAHFGWTGKGPAVLLKLRAKIANPAITVYQQGMHNLEDLINEQRAAGRYVVAMGDWNFDAFADLRAAAKAEYYGPHATMRRCGARTVYSTGALKHGTAGKRGIDYITLAAPTTKEKA